MNPAFRPEIPAPISPLRKAWLALLLLVFSWHGLVLQSHVHIAGRHGAPGLSSARGATLAQTVGSGERERLPVGSESCPIEREGALSGAFLSPVAPVLAEQAATADWHYRACARPSAHRSVAHDWRSRAPPSVGLFVAKA